MELLTTVEVVADDATWGHPPRQEIVGAVGAIVGTTEQIGVTKDYVSLPKLGRVYGIARLNLKSLKVPARLDEHLPFFAQHYFDLATYSFTMSTRRSHTDIATALSDMELDYPPAALRTFPEYAMTHLELLRENAPPLSVSDDALRRFLNTYAEQLHRRLAKV